MSEDEVSSINEMMEAFTSATTTIAQAYKEVTRTVAEVPTNAYNFTLLVKTYANLLYGLFGAQYPLYQTHHQSYEFVPNKMH